MWTLSIDAVDANGGPAYGVLIQLLNVDDAAKFAITTGFGMGPIKFSVPVGHYSLTAILVTFENGTLVERTDVQPQFTVKGLTTVTADFRRATTAPAASVAQPAQLTARTLGVVRSARINGGLGIFSADQPTPGAPPTSMLVSPTGGTTIGKFRYDTYWHFVSPDGGASYTYDLDFPSLGSIPAQQSHQVADSDLATLDARYDSEVDGQVAAVGRGLITGVDLTFMGFVPLYPLALPATRVEYVTANPDAHWESEVLRSEANGFDDWFADTPRSYQPGTVQPLEWLRQPLHPGVDRLPQPWFEPLICGACRQGDLVNLIIEPYADNVAGHVAAQHTVTSGTDGTASGSYQLIQDGQSIAGGEYLDGVQIPVSAEPATYQLTYDVDREAPWWTLSTSTHTEWTFHSQETSRSLPHGWFCDVFAETNCYFLPMIFADYQVPVDDTGHEAPGATSLTVAPFYLQPTAAPRITGVDVQVSFDDGQTWQSANVASTSRDECQATYSNPGAGFVALRVTVTDADGDRFSQTIQRAYAIG